MRPRAAAAAARAGRPVIRLTVGQPHLPPPSHLLAAFAAANESALGHRYPPVGGLPQLREIVARRSTADHRRIVSADEVIITVGAKGAIANTLEAVIDPGDEVLLAAPYWSGFVPAIERCGARAVVVRHPDRRTGLLSAEQVAEHGTSRTKVVILNSPSNPTGAMYSEAELRKLGDAVGSLPRTAVVLSDEIYEDLSFAPGGHVPAARLIRDVPVVTVSGWSKCYAMTGDRLGYAVGPREVIAAIEAIQSVGAYPAPSPNTPRRPHSGTRAPSPAASPFTTRRTGSRPANGCPASPGSGSG